MMSVRHGPKNVFVTGRPGIGKTTAVTRAADAVSTRGISVGGFVSSEVREGGQRMGFVVRDLQSGETAWLARVGDGYPRVGKYRVLVDEFERVGVKAIYSAIGSANLVVIDEIGPMELLSAAFRRAVLSALDSPKPVIATIHYKARENDFGRTILSRSDYQLLEITLSNRDAMPAKIAGIILSLLTRG